MQKQYKILLYYKYVPLSDPETYKIVQKELCESLGIKGRIILATEGINATIAGSEESIDRYIELTSSLPEFSDIEWKISWADEQVFPKLKIKVRDEIVTLGIKKTGIDVSLSNKAHYIEPEELVQLYENNEDFIILDARNTYEAAIGKFQNALLPPIDTFREFPAFVESHLSQYKDKPIVTYCTGGVRCEKASAYLREHGFTKVRQLHGGVHVYAEKTKGKYFEGELFVFDKRLHTPVNSINPSITSKCLYCQKPITRLIDCADTSCIALFSCCCECETKHDSRCSDHCYKKI